MIQNYQISTTRVDKVKPTVKCSLAAQGLTDPLAEATHSLTLTAGPTSWPRKKGWRKYNSNIYVTVFVTVHFSVESDAQMLQNRIALLRQEELKT